MRRSEPRAWPTWLARLVHGWVALVCLLAGTYLPPTGAPMPPQVVVLAAETEAELRADVAPVLRIVALKRAATPLRDVVASERSAGRSPARPRPASASAPDSQPRGPPHLT